MEEEAPATEPDTSFEQSAKEARRAQWALNLLVILSAVAGAAFFGYVIFTIRPFGNKTPPGVNVPTSSVGAKFGLLTGSDDDSGVTVFLRDIDEAPSYRQKLSDVMRKDLGIASNGRLYLLVVRNDGKKPTSVDAGKLQVKDSHGKAWQARWLDDVADASKASATGRMRLAQSAHKFELGAGEERQVYVFIPSGDGALPPSGEDFVDGELSLSAALDIPLAHKEIKATAE